MLAHKVCSSRLKFSLERFLLLFCSLVLFPAARTPIRACDRSRSSSTRWCSLVASGVCAGLRCSGHAVHVVHPAGRYRLCWCASLRRGHWHHRRRCFPLAVSPHAEASLSTSPCAYASSSHSGFFVARLAGATRTWHADAFRATRRATRDLSYLRHLWLDQPVHAHSLCRCSCYTVVVPSHASAANGLTNRWSQPLAAVKSAFDFMKQFSMFATLAPASGGSAPSR